MSEAVPPAKAVRDPESFRGALDAWMRRQFPERRELRVHAVDMPRATGFSNETVFFSASWSEAGRERSERYVARIEPRDGGLFPVQTPACAVSVGLQHRIMQTAARTGKLPIPPLLPYEADPAVLGSPFFVMSFVDGLIPADVPRYSTAGFLVERATPAERECMVRGGIETLAALHSVDWKSAGLDWLDVSGVGQPSVRDQLQLYRSYCALNLAGREHPVLMQALDWLDAKAPRCEAGIAWGDARLGNMIWQDYRCAAVCDWEAVALAPPESDIGWWLMFDRMSFDDMGAARLEGFPTREQMLEQWESLTGRSGTDIHYWEAFGTLRFAAIMIKLGDRMVKAGLMPPEQSQAIDNGVTLALAKQLGIDYRPPQR